MKEQEPLKLNNSIVCVSCNQMIVISQLPDRRVLHCILSCSIDLVTVFDAILTSRQTREKLQCLYENLMSNNFLRTAVLSKISIVNLSYIAKDCPKKIWWRTCA